MNHHHIDKDAPVWQMTVGELIYCIKESLPPQIFSSDNSSSEEEFPDKVYIKGLKNLANYLGLSYSQTWRLKKEGVFDHAIKQRNRTIFIHRKKVLELFAEKSQNRK